MYVLQHNVRSLFRAILLGGFCVTAIFVGCKIYKGLLIREICRISLNNKIENIYNYGIKNNCFGKAST